MKKHKLLIILPFFYNGGVERWSSYIIEALKNEDFDVSIASIGPILNSPLDFGVSGFVERISFFSAIKKVLIPENQFILTALTKLNLILSIVGFFSRKKVISSVHLSLGKKNNESLVKYHLRKTIYFFIVKFSYKVICVSNGVKMELDSISKSSKTFVIYNPCFRLNDINLNRIPLFSPDGGIRFVSAGRLHSQKQFDVMILSFASSLKFLPKNSSLTIYGDGELFNELTQLIFELNVQDFVFLKPFSSNLFVEFKKHNVFLLTSEYEGFGNVLVEALAIGLNCISFDIPHGPSEILDNGNYGILINGSQEFLIKTLSTLTDRSFPTFESTSLFSHLIQFTDGDFKESFKTKVVMDV